jgi:hypothetical protein
MYVEGKCVHVAARNNLHVTGTRSVYSQQSACILVCQVCVSDERIPVHQYPGTCTGYVLFF